MEVMLDLETMSSKNNAALVSIGAVKFDHEGVHERFYMPVILASSEHYGLKISGDTVGWWLKQSPEAIKALFDNPQSLTYVLEAFTSWCKGHRDTLGPVKNALTDKDGIWGNGADFDNVILRNAYEAVGLECPWNHRQSRCYRTLKNLAKHIELNRQGVHHHALHDAETQAFHAIAILKELKVWTA